MNRIKEVRMARGIKQVDICKRIGIAQSTLSQWETGKSQPDGDSLRRLSAVLDVSIDYLLGNDMEATTDAPASTGGVWIPVYGKVAAGIPIEAVEDIIDHEEISSTMARNGSHIALQIHGDSMEPRMRDGDVVIVHVQDDVESGEIAIVMVNGDEATCKKIKKTPDGILLIATNPAYEPMYYTNRQIMHLPVKIVGKVVELRAKF